MSKLGGEPKIPASYGVPAQAGGLGACASFSYMDGMPGAYLHAAPLEARSYSDLGPAAISAVTAAVIAHSADGDDQGKGVPAAGWSSCCSNDVLPKRDPLDVVFYQQYNNHYGLSEGVNQGPGMPRYYPCSNRDPGIAAVGGAGVGSWSMRFLDPEVKRRGRLASYRAISFEGKLKSSLRKRFKWFKHKCSSMLTGAAGCPPHVAAAGSKECPECFAQRSDLFPSDAIHGLAVLKEDFGEILLF